PAFLRGVAGGPGRDGAGARGARSGRERRRRAEDAVSHRAHAQGQRGEPRLRGDRRDDPRDGKRPRLPARREPGGQQAGHRPAAPVGRCAARDAGRGAGVTLRRAELRERLRALSAGAEAAGAPEDAREDARQRAAAEASGPRAELPAQGTRTLRISLDTLDRILDLTGEIAVDRGRLREALERGGGDGREAAEM